MRGRIPCSCYLCVRAFAGPGDRPQGDAGLLRGGGGVSCDRVECPGGEAFCATLDVVESVQARFCGGGCVSSDLRGVQLRLEVEGRPRLVLVRLVFVEAAMSGLERKVCAVETGGLRRHPAITGEKPRLAPQLLSF
jgi:hypothetical protein